jgi:S-DNA-T family DNA segregation ATPase FtsK/SpoIIIE
VRLKLTLARPSGSSDDIVVTADAAASIAEVASTVARIDPRRTGPVAAPRSRGSTRDAPDRSPHRVR